MVSNSSSQPSFTLNLKHKYRRSRGRRLFTCIHSIMPVAHVERKIRGAVSYRRPRSFVDPQQHLRFISMRTSTSKTPLLFPYFTLEYFTNRGSAHQHIGYGWSRFYQSHQTLSHYVPTEHLPAPVVEMPVWQRRGGGCYTTCGAQGYPRVTWGEDCW